ncbi:hypothetical protein CMUS01_10914 [Colletotrichum musicola]|uniref:Uncharacterized protein n=1 Tax=Colletotrichum musicola TaxID=2175873 RepID=A0A8H6K0K5_9PEZI|nr:hypothetical protein CMUS01_10914 [Colletotrichum musicola]
MQQKDIHSATWKKDFSLERLAGAARLASSIRLPVRGIHRISDPKLQAKQARAARARAGRVAKKAEKERLKEARNARMAHARSARKLSTDKVVKAGK